MMMETILIFSNKNNRMMKKIQIMMELFKCSPLFKREMNYNKLTLVARPLAESWLLLTQMVVLDPLESHSVNVDVNLVTLKNVNNIEESLFILVVGLMDLLSINWKKRKKKSKVFRELIQVSLIFRCHWKRTAIGSLLNNLVTFRHFSICPIGLLLHLEFNLSQIRQFGHLLTLLNFFLMMNSIDRYLNTRRENWIFNQLC